MKRTFLYILAALLAASCKNSSVQNNKSEGDKPVIDRKSTRLNSSHDRQSRMPSSA